MKLGLVLLLVPATAFAQPTRREPDRSQTYAVAVDGHPGDGPADAKVTIVVAHDYADPYSEKNRATLDELRKKYQRDLRIVFRNMVVHPRNAMAAALASCAAHKQKKFDLMEDKLWEGWRNRQLDMSDVDLGNGPQKCWDTPDGCTHVTSFARDIGLDMMRFKADMQACESVVADDMRELSSEFAINATPSFFVNGRFISGAFPTPEFVKIVDEELAKANDRIKKGTPKARYYKMWVVDKGLKRVDGVASTTTRPPMPMPVAPRPPRREPDKALSYAVPVDGYPSKGAADAKVTIVIFYDYATPYAERNRTVLDDLLQRYGKELRIVYRNRLVHPNNAMAAALGGCAANKQKKFGPFDEMMWEKGFKGRQFDLSDVPQQQGPNMKCWDTVEGCTNVVGYAKELGLDVARFKADMKTCVAAVNADDTEAGASWAVNATPTFFINGRVLMGAQPVEAFAAVIDDEMTKATDRIKKGMPKARYYKAWVVDKGEKTVAP